MRSGAYSFRVTPVARRVVGISTGGQLLVRGEIRIVERDAAVVVPEVGRVIVVRLALAVVAVEAVEALLERIALLPGRPRPHLPNAPVA